MIKVSNANAGGTSFHGTTINTTVSALKKCFGKPEYDFNDGSDKVNFEWVGETSEGFIVTIYDWKEYRKLKMREPIEFHIGGRSSTETNAARRQLLQLLK